MKLKNSSEIFRYCTILLVLCHLGGFDATLSKKSKQTKAKKSDSSSTSSATNGIVGKTEKDVFDRHLVTEKLKVPDILKYFQSYSRKTSKRHASGDVLGYVTPWNNHGYDIAKTFAGKFTLISPVWLQITKQHSGQFAMNGGHDIDNGWIKDLKKGNKNLKVVPRVLFDGWSVSDFHTLFQSRERLYELVDYIIGYLEHYKFDGMVLEVWVQYSGHYKAELSGLVKELGEAMISKKLKLILAIPPPLYAENMLGLFTKDDFDILSPVVDYFSLMTYDYPNNGRPGANAPYEWIVQCIKALTPLKNTERAKILLGMNFYGMDYKYGGASPMIGRSYIDFVRGSNPRIEWLQIQKEHKMTVKTQESSRTVFYPSLKSISERITLANELGTGLSIWELGQGLDYFYDLL